MMHDFGVTATRVVFMDLPVVFDLELVAQGYACRSAGTTRYRARIGVMPRDGGDADVRWIEIEPCYVYHPLNAYDDGERIVMDVVRHARTFDTSRIGPERRQRAQLCAGRSIRRGHACDRSVLDDHGQEFPRVDPRRECRAHRYGYAVQARVADHGGLALRQPAQARRERGTTEVHDVGPAGSRERGRVRALRATGEDEGYVLAPVYDAVRGASDVRVLDARNFTRQAARDRAPAGAHPVWLSRQLRTTRFQIMSHAGKGRASRAM